MAAKKKSKSKAKARNKAVKTSAPKTDTNIPSAGGTAGPDAQQVPPQDGETALPKATKRSKQEALAARSRKKKPVSTAIAGLGPTSPTDKSGNFTGTPGEDIQAKPPLAPTETRNTIVAASHGQKPETNMNRSIADHMEKVAPNVTGSNLDVGVVAPAVVDEDNVKAVSDAQGEADKITRQQDKAREEFANA
jgi:hypothetical protein